MQKKGFNNIICFGEVLWDMLPSGAQPGGAPLNVAIHLNRQRIHPLLVSKVGKDKEGEDLKEFLVTSGLATDFIHTDTDLPTSKVIVKLDRNKNATYEICEPVAWDNIIIDEKMEMAAQKADLIVFGSLALRNATTRKTLFSLLEKSNATRLFDVNLRPPHADPGTIKKLLHKSDFIKLNDDELRIICGYNKKEGTVTELITFMSEYYRCTAICVTRGAKGAALFIDDMIYEHPGFRVNAKDTVGAGDAFLAALIAKLGKKLNPQQALTYACATGALVASRDGAVPDYSEQDIEKIINSSSQ